jgi:hypothetical protein
MHLKKQLKDLDAIRITCLRCEHLKAGRRCDKFDAKPPDEWLHGPIDCEHWLWDAVPF